jgi:hypothetical protein
VRQAQEVPASLAAAHRHELCKIVKAVRGLPDDVIHSARADAPSDDRFTAGGPGVAVADRVAQEASLTIEQAEVCAPSIDADAGDPDSPPGAEAQGLQQVVPEAQEVPVQCLSQQDRPIGKAMHLFQVQPPAPQRARNRPPAAGAKVPPRYVCFPRVICGP